MSTPLSFCDISARYGQMPAPRQTPAEQTGWDANQLFLDYMRKLQDRRQEVAEDAEEDALMAMIDAMNAPEEDKESGKADADATNALADAGRAIIAQHEELQADGTKAVEYVDPTKTLTIQGMLACLGDRFVFEQTDEVQESQEKVREAQEQGSEKEGLEVTEERGPSRSGDPNQIAKEV